MTDAIQKQSNQGRKISRKQRPVSGNDHARQKTQDEVFMTVPERTREGSLLRQSPPSPKLDDDLDDEPETSEKPDVDEIKKKLYQRECSKLGITPVGAFLRSPTRTEISIRHYSLGPAGARALAVPLMLDSAMTHLDLEGNGIGDDGLASMSEMLMDHCGLSHLNLKRNGLKSKGASIICQVLQANKLIVSLCVAANEFDDKDGVVFADMLKENSHLKSLDLSDNRLGHVTGRHLGEALRQNDTLETLDLSWNQFREGGAANIMEGVKDNVTLKTLKLAFNSFGRGLCEKPYEILGQALAANTSLKSLDVSNNRLVDLDFVMVAKSLKSNEALQTLKIGHNLVGVKAAAILLKSLILCENSGIKLLDLENIPIASESLADVIALEERGVKVAHGLVHQKETDFESEPRESRHEEARLKAEAESSDGKALDGGADGNEDGGRTNVKANVGGSDAKEETKPGAPEEDVAVFKGDTVEDLRSDKDVEEDFGERNEEAWIEAKEGENKDVEYQVDKEVTTQEEGNKDDVVREQETDVSGSETNNPEDSSGLETRTKEDDVDKFGDENKVKSGNEQHSASTWADEAEKGYDNTGDIVSSDVVIGVTDPQIQNNDATDSSVPSFDLVTLTDETGSKTIDLEVKKDEEKRDTGTDE